MVAVTATKPAMGVQTPPANIAPPPTSNAPKIKGNPGQPEWSAAAPSTMREVPAAIRISSPRPEKPLAKLEKRRRTGKRCLLRSKRNRHLAVQLQLPASLDTSIDYAKWYWRCIYLIQSRLTLLVSID